MAFAELLRSYGRDPDFVAPTGVKEMLAKAEPRDFGLPRR